MPLNMPRALGTVSVIKQYFFVFVFDDTVILDAHITTFTLIMKMRGTKIQKTHFIR